MKTTPSFMDLFAYNLIEELWKSQVVQSKEPHKQRFSSEGQRSCLYFQTEFKEKCNNNDDNSSHVYFFDVSFEWNYKDSNMAFDSNISIKIGAMVEFPKNGDDDDGALYLQTNPLNRDYLMNFAEGICIDETGPAQIAKVFLEALETCIVKQCHLKQQQDDNGTSSEVSIQIINYHPGLEQNVRFFNVRTHDYRKGYVGSTALGLFPKNQWFHSNTSSMDIFREFWHQHFLDECSKAKNPIITHTMISSINNGRLQEKEKDGSPVATTSVVGGTQGNKRSIMKLQPLHGVIRCKKKKPSKLVYETI
jgi:hypothetical protein